MRLPTLDRRRLLLALTGAALLAYAACFWMVSGYTADQAGTNFCYARNLAQGRGLVPTAGGERAEGYTSLLWVLLLSIAAGHGLSPIGVAKAAAFLFGAASICLMAWLPARLGEREPSWLDGLPPLLLAVSSPFVIWPAAGLEGSLFVLLLLAALALFTSETRGESTLPLSAGVLSLAALARPEGPLYVALVWPAVAIGNRQRIRATVEWTAVAAAAMGLYLFWRQSYFGDSSVALGPWANALAAAPSHDGSGLQGFLEYASDRWPLWLAALTIVGLTSLAKHPSGPWVACGAIAAGLAVFTQRGDWTAHHRVSGPLAAFALLALGEGTRRAVAFLYSPGLPSLSRDGSTLAAVALVGAVSLRIAVPGLADARASLGARPDDFRHRARLGESLAATLREAGMSVQSVCARGSGGLAWGLGADLVDLAGEFDRTIERFGQSRTVLEEYVLDQRRPQLVRLDEPGMLPAPMERRLATEYVLLPGLAADAERGTHWLRRDALRAQPGEPGVTPMDVGFGSELALAAAGVNPPAVSPGGAVEVLQLWRRLGPARSGQQVRVTLRGPNGERFWRQRALLSGWLPVTRWEPSEHMRERMRIEVPASASEGRYEIEISVLDAAGGELPSSSRPPAPLHVAVGRAQARSRARATAEILSRESNLPADSKARAAISEAGSRAAPHLRLAHAVRGLELAAALSDMELERARHWAARDSCRIAELLASAGDADGAAGSLRQARLWGCDTTESSQRVSSILTRWAGSVAARNSLRTAARILTAALSANPHDVAAIRARDAIWSRLSLVDIPAPVARATTAGGTPDRG
ncbi:MAG: hypothetical protein HYY25_00865 [Candidatus Wallbacteria bacterium]|nr:hypothetical protein [Candidatus Wallbacteria bacterium]